MKTQSRKLLATRIFFISYIALLLIGCVDFFIQNVINETIINNTEFGGYEYSDWLINYEGGFVRRGLIGQILLWFYHIIPFDVKTAIAIITYTSTLTLAIITGFLFYKHRVSLFLLPCVFMIGGLFMNGLIIYRRDALILLMIIFILYLYRRMLTAENRKTPMIAFQTICIITILTYEASFFCFAPFIFLHYYFTRPLPTPRKLLHTALFAIPIITTMAISCIYKGNDAMVQIIWDSWKPYLFEKYGELDWIGYGVSSLSWKLLDTIALHFNLNFLSFVDWNVSPLHTNALIPSVPIWIIIYCAVYYLSINANKVQVVGNEYENHNNPNNQYLPQILIIQFISLLPLFTVLSCDLRRIIIFWVMTSFYISFMLQDINKPFNIPHIKPFADKTAHFFLNGKLLKNTVFFITCALFLGIPFYKFIISDALFSTVIFYSYYIIRYIILALF